MQVQPAYAAAGVLVDPGAGRIRAGVRRVRGPYSIRLSLFSYTVERRGDTSRGSCRARARALTAVAASARGPPALAGGTTPGRARARRGEERRRPARAAGSRHTHRCRVANHNFETSGCEQHTAY